MKSPSLFPMWFLIKQLKPKVIIESGVWKGQGTWFIEKAAPQAKLYCIDPNLTRLAYKSKKAVYSTVDFAKQNWSQLPKDKTLIFFDDHQNAMDRIRLIQSLGFKHVIFEDNYPANQGGTYSLKKVFKESGYHPYLSSPFKYQKFIYFLVAKKVYLTQVLNGSIVLPNKRDHNFLKKILEIYYEFPPIFESHKTKVVLSKKPLFSLNCKNLNTFKNETRAYCWICYAKLK